MNWKKTFLILVAILLVVFMNTDGVVPMYRNEILNDTVFQKLAIVDTVQLCDTVAVEQDTIEEKKVDVPLQIARLLEKELILSTDGTPLDAVEIRRTVEAEFARRADTNKNNFRENYCVSNMAYFNIADDWAQIICFPRKDDKFLVFLIQFFDWREGYGIISAKYFIFDGEKLQPTDNPLKRFSYIAGNKDTIHARYDFRMMKTTYDPNRLKVNTAMQNIEHGGVDDVINAEFLWTGRDFIELASDHSLPKRDDIVRIWNQVMPQGADLPEQYARTDIDSDGNDEYIFRVNDGTDSRFAIFSYMNGKLSLVAGNYGSDRQIKMLLGGFVLIQDAVQTRYIKLMASDVEGIYISREGKYTAREGREAKDQEITKDDFEKVVRRARKEVAFKTLDWRFWSEQTAR